MADQETITLNLQNAPLIVGLSALGSSSQLELEWPNKLSFAEFTLPQKSLEETKEQLEWIKRQYDALMTNKNTSVYAPHVMPYLALADLHIGSKGGDFAAAAMTGDYPLEYIKNLRSALKGRSDITINQPIAARETKGALIEDRTRFRVIKSSPLNEMEGGFLGFYETSGLTYAAAYESWLELNYDDKQQLLIRQLKAGRVKALYELEVILEPQLLLDGLRAGLFKISAIQPPTPSHGYSLPRNLPDGGMVERCFDISYQLYSKLSKNHAAFAPLVCLWGHRQRALIKTDIDSIKSMAVVEKSRLKRLSNVLLDKLAQKHPIVIEEVRATTSKE